MPLWLSKGEGKPPKENGGFWEAYTEMMSALENLEIEGYERIGYVAVDSGQLIVGDPANVEQANELFEHDLNSDNGYHILGAARREILAVSTGLGDGFYPVFIRRGFQGRVAELVVVFLPPMEGEDAPAETAREDK